MKWLKDTGDEVIDTAIFAVEISENVGLVITRDGEGVLITRGPRAQQYVRARARIALVRSTLRLSQLGLLLVVATVLRTSSSRAAQDEADIHRIVTALVRALRALFGQDTDPELPPILSSAEFRVRAGGLFNEHVKSEDA